MLEQDFPRFSTPACLLSFFLFLSSLLEPRARRAAPPPIVPGRLSCRATAACVATDNN